MQSKILLNSNEDTRKIEAEEKSRFIRGILSSMSVPLEGLWDEDEELSVEKRIKLRTLLSSFNIKIIEYVDGTLEIYVDNELIAEWKKCEYVLKKDPAAIDPTKKLYLEMKIDFWSIFETS